MLSGAYDGFSSKLIQLNGFDAVYLTGAGVSYSTLGQPDVGLLTQTEMTDRVRTIDTHVAAVLRPAAPVGMVARATRHGMWVIADGDTGTLQC